MSEHATAPGPARGVVSQQSHLENFDVVVVGAGPAGGRIARDLALQGFSVALLEEHASIGTPMHCSGLVTRRTLEQANVGDDLILNAIRGAEFHLPSGHRMVVGGDRDHAYVIDRAELDRRIVAQAVDAGAVLMLRTRYMDHEVTGHAVGGFQAGDVVVHAIRDGERATFRARLLVGAGGAHSMIAGKLNGVRRRHLVHAVGAVVTGVPVEPANRVNVFLDADAAPGWFGWSIPLGDGTARLGTGSAVETTTARESLSQLADLFPDTFANATVISRSAGAIATWAPARIVGDRTLLVGDAARQAKPTSGGGIYAALVASGIAAREIGAAFHAGDLSERRLQRYETAWYESFGREMRRSYDLRQIATRLSARQLERLFEAVERPNVRQAIDAVGDIDFPSRVAWALLRADPLLAVSMLRLPRYPLAWLG